MTDLDAMRDDIKNKRPWVERLSAFGAEGGFYFYPDGAGFSIRYGIDAAAALAIYRDGMIEYCVNTLSADTKAMRDAVVMSGANRTAALRDVCTATLGENA